MVQKGTCNDLRYRPGQGKIAKNIRGIKHGVLERSFVTCLILRVSFNVLMHAANASATAFFMCTIYSKKKQPPSPEI